MAQNSSANHRLQSKKIQKSIFRNLLISMITFGVVVGLIFPPFARLVLDSERALSLLFFTMCIFAGFLVGIVNYQLFNVVVSKELKRVVDGMHKVLHGVARAEVYDETCGDDCLLEVTSNDSIGEIELAFNDMTQAISRRLYAEQMNQLLHSEISASVELEEVSRAILSIHAEVHHAKAGLIYGDTGNNFQLLSSMGVDLTDQVPNQINKNLGPISLTLESGEIQIFAPKEDGFEWIEQTTPVGSFRPAQILVIPLIDKQRTVGLVITASNKTALDQNETQILNALRTQSAPYLQNAILHRKVRDLAALDDLTMILNRRFGLRRLQEEFSRSVRHGVPVSVLMIDIDHFKMFNDTFGHDAGDAVLRSIAETLESNLRSGDVICRYGGEEFLVVAPGTGVNDAAVLADRLRRIIETDQVPWGNQSLAVTVSMGQATWPVERASISEELVTAADRALYHAKASGRNCVAIARGEEILSLEALEAEKTKTLEAAA